MRKCRYIDDEPQTQQPKKLLKNNKKDALLTFVSRRLLELAMRRCQSDFIPSFV